MTDRIALPTLIAERSAADMLDVSVSTIQRMRKAGKIKAKLIGGRWKYRLDWIREYLDEADNTCANDSANARSETTISRSDRIQPLGVQHGMTVPLDRHAANLLAQATFGKPK